MPSKRDSKSSCSSNWTSFGVCVPAHSRCQALTIKGSASKRRTPIVEALGPVEELRFDPNDPRLAHTRMTRNCGYVIISLPYDLIGMHRGIKIIGIKFAHAHASPFGSLSISCQTTPSAVC